MQKIKGLVSNINTKSPPGSDHYFHLKLVDFIKKSGHKFVKEKSYLEFSEKNFSYPQLFHWILSFLPEKIYEEKYKYITLSVKILEILAFNIFLIFLSGRLQFEGIDFFYANVIVNIFPFSYAAWNSKNTGLSARGIGLVSGQIYTYLIVAYVLTNNMILLFALFAVVFVIMILSQMAMQYVLLSIPFFVLFFKIPEIIAFPFLSFCLFYAIMPQVAKNYIIGQYNHKRNYALFLADIFILKNRPSIYRDFIYDFWIKLKKNFISGMAYIYLNPLLEIFYGIPFLWFVLYAGSKNELNKESYIMLYTILAALAVFFITSFRWTRFLGEPQRYLEFVIPLITIVYVKNFDFNYHIVLISFSLLISFIPRIILKNHTKTQITKSNRNALVNYLANDTRFNDKICISNDYDLLKYLPPLGINIIKPDLTIFYKSRADFDVNFNNNIKELSFKALLKYVNELKPNFLIINSEFYDFDTLQSNIQLRNFSHVIDFNEYALYEIVY